MESGVAVALMVVGVVLLLAWSDKRSGSKERRVRPLFEIEGDGDFAIEVVGESHYQEALRSVVPGDDYVQHPCSARLVCEDDNPHDKNAVRVEIDGLLVGYLSRSEARAYRNFMREKNIVGATGIAKAKIFGGGRKSYGVWLDI